MLASTDRRPRVEVGWPDEIISRTWRHRRATAEYHALETLSPMIVISGPDETKGWIALAAGHGVHLKPTIDPLMISSRLLRSRPSFSREGPR